MLALATLTAPALHAGNDARVTLAGLRSAATGSHLNAATVTAQLYDEADAAVGDPVTLAYVAASSGGYAGVVESGVVDGLGVGAFYRLAVAASEGGVDGEWNVTGTVGRRGTG